MTDQAESDGRNIVNMHGSGTYTEVQHKNYRTSSTYRDQYPVDHVLVHERTAHPIKFGAGKEGLNKPLKEKDKNGDCEGSDGRFVAQNSSSAIDLQYIPIESEPPPLSLFESTHQNACSYELSLREGSFYQNRSKTSPEEFYSYHPDSFVAHPQMPSPEYTSTASSRHPSHCPQPFLIMLPENSVARPYTATVSSGSQKMFDSPGFGNSESTHNSAFGNEKLRKKFNPNPKDSNRKSTHNEVERRRRDKINTCVERIMTLIPCTDSEVKSSTTSVASKFNILNRACQYIEELNNTLVDNKQLLEEIERLKRRISYLALENDRLVQENESLQKKMRSGSSGDTSLRTGSSHK